MEHLREIFDAFDVDGSGFISKQELGDALRKMGLEPSSEQLDELLRQGDHNGDAELSFHEFVKLMMHHDGNGEAQPQHMHRAACQGGNHQISTGNDFTSIKEIAAAFEQYRVHSTKEHRQGGDPSLQSRANMQKRREMRSNGAVVKALKTYWTNLARGATYISKDEVFNFQIRLCKALFDEEDWDPNFAKRVVEEDWIREMGNKTHMTEDEFSDSLYETIDVWTTSVDIKEYTYYFERVEAGVFSKHDGSLLPLAQIRSIHEPTALQRQNTTTEAEEALGPEPTSTSMDMLDLMPSYPQTSSGAGRAKSDQARQPFVKPWSPRSPTPRRPFRRRYPNACCIDNWRPAAGMPGMVEFQESLSSTRFHARRFRPASPVPGDDGEGDGSRLSPLRPKVPQNTATRHRGACIPTSGLWSVADGVSTVSWEGITPTKQEHDSAISGSAGNFGATNGLRDIHVHFRNRNLLRELQAEDRQGMKEALNDEGSKVCAGTALLGSPRIQFADDEASKIGQLSTTAALRFVLQKLGATSDPKMYRVAEAILTASWGEKQALATSPGEWGAKKKIVVDRRTQQSTGCGKGYVRCRDITIPIDSSRGLETKTNSGDPAFDRVASSLAPLPIFHDKKVGRTTKRMFKQAAPTVSATLKIDMSSAVARRPKQVENLRPSTTSTIVLQPPVCRPVEAALFTDFVPQSEWGAPLHVTRTRKGGGGRKDMVRGLVMAPLELELPAHPELEK